MGGGREVGGGASCDVQDSHRTDHRCTHTVCGTIHVHHI